jgi:pimeloyl-ACP methyl ester carboxylesterase
MHLYYFGDSEKPLFGIYHPPRSGRIRDKGVVLCYPAAQEYVRSHRAFQQLANLLSKAGFHVMRFDYYGSGDSYGDSREGGVAQWKADIQAAIDELKDTSGVKKISLIGLRLGATLAAITSTDRTDIVDLVLWDPVVNGKAYIERLKAMHQLMLRDLSIFQAPRVQSPEAEDLLGFPFPPGIRTEIQQLDLLNGQRCRARRMFLIMSEEKEEYVQLRDSLKARDIRFHYRVIPGPGEWDDVGSIRAELMPYEIVQTITKELVKEQT